MDYLALLIVAVILMIVHFYHAEIGRYINTEPAAVDHLSLGIGAGIIAALLVRRADRDIAGGNGAGGNGAGGNGAEEDGGDSGNDIGNGGDVVGGGPELPAVLRGLIRDLKSADAEGHERRAIDALSKANKSTIVAAVARIAGAIKRRARDVGPLVERQLQKAIDAAALYSKS